MVHVFTLESEIIVEADYTYKKVCIYGNEFYFPGLFWQYLFGIVSFFSTKFFLPPGIYMGWQGLLLWGTCPPLAGQHSWSGRATLGCFVVFFASGHRAMRCCHRTHLCTWRWCFLYTSSKRIKLQQGSNTGGPHPYRITSNSRVGLWIPWPPSSWRGPHRRPAQGPIFRPDFPGYLWALSYFHTYSSPWSLATPLPVSPFPLTC